MTVKYNVISRKNPQKPEDPPKYYPSIKSTGRTGTRELARTMAQISTLSPIDMAAALEAFLTVVPQELAKGNIVDLGEFGSFWLRTTGMGQVNEADVKANHIDNVKPYFRPGKEFKQVLQTIHFAKE